MTKKAFPALILAAALALAATLAACGSGSDSLTVYSGRSQTLVQPILERFSEETGIKIRVRYGDTAELAATILEEGKNSPADVFFAQDAGALGALSEKGRLVDLPAGLLDRVPQQFRSPEGKWVGVSGRSRVLVYNTKKLSESDLPNSVLDLTDPKWKGRLGWAPTNGSFQAFVTALRKMKGEEAAAAWLQGVKANSPKDYPNNVALVKAVGDGEVDVGLSNHYYLFSFLKEEGEGFAARNFYFKKGDPGGLVNVAGAGILDTSSNREDAHRFLEFLLSSEAQQYFADETFEYPLVQAVKTAPGLASLSSLEPPAINLGDLADLEGTLKLLRETKVLP